MARHRRQSPVSRRPHARLRDPEMTRQCIETAKKQRAIAPIGHAIVDADSAHDLFDPRLAFLQARDRRVMASAQICDALRISLRELPARTPAKPAAHPDVYGVRTDVTDDVTAQLLRLAALPTRRSRGAWVRSKGR